MLLYGLAMMIIREQMNRYNIDEFNLQLGYVYYQNCLSTKVAKTTYRFL